LGDEDGEESGGSGRDRAGMVDFALEVEVLVLVLVLVVLVLVLVRARDFLGGDNASKLDSRS
jgi:hypothetical protein